MHILLCSERTICTKDETCLSKSIDDILHLGCNLFISTINKNTASILETAHYSGIREELSSILE